ncbi:MAG: outer membrane protein assembly factor BamB family protein, partial [Planctomycetota bacterium]
PIEKWHTHLWPLKSGPAQLPRRLVAIGDRVYVTIGIDAPVSELDAATGETVKTYPQTKGAEEMLYSNGTILALAQNQTQASGLHDIKRAGGGYGAVFWDEQPRQLVVVKADTGDVLWSKEHTVLPGTLAALNGRVFFHNGERIICLDEKSGKRLWRSYPVARARQILGFYLPILVVYNDVVLFSGGETAGLQTGSWYRTGKDTMTAFSAENGEVRWTADHPPSGYRSPEDLLVVNGLVWTGETTSGRAEGLFTGRDPHTGKIKAEFTPEVDVYWFHHRCYRGKATDNYLLMSRTGTEFLDVRTQQWTVNHWARGACLYGIMPANGMLYNAPHPCACYLEAKLNGFNALAPASKGPRVSKKAAKRARLERGPAYERNFTETTAAGDWPTYRRDMARTGRTETPVSTALKSAWESKVGPRLTSPVVAGGKVFVASVDTHTVHALDVASGEELWAFTAGGRVDSPPTIYEGRVLFGSADGYVYCLDASDGALAWRFRAATTDQRLMSFEQIESVWPVHGNVLVRDGTAYFAAGRSMFLDGGIHFYRIDAKTGKMISHTVLDEQEEATEKELHSFVSWLNMPPALPDILSSDGKLVYMRSQPFTLDGKRLPLEAMPMGKDADAGAPPPTQYPKYAHIFSPTGFLDDSWWHRTYWMYGSSFYSGWCGYFTAGKAAPAGRILVFDDTTVYGFGRKPQYYRWTTPIEHHLFASPRVASDEKASTSGGPSIIRVEKSGSLNIANKEITVE